MSKNVKDIIVPILKTMQVDIAFAKADISVLKEKTKTIQEEMISTELDLIGLMTSIHSIETGKKISNKRIKNLENKAKK